ncbi:MAG: hypothetical protein Q9163_006522 [Psora crenata]
MPEHTEEDFEEHVSEASRLFLEKTVKGFYLCENGLGPPQIPFHDYQFQGLPALDKLLMEWGRNETCAKNEGYSGWHAKYMAACCYLLQGYKESNTQTTIRTTRCAVIMINQVLSSAHEVWGDHAFTIWPALAMKGYLLASVGRHAEPVRRAIVARVSKKLVSDHEKPKIVDYDFNPVRLMSALLGARYVDRRRKKNSKIPKKQVDSDLPGSEQTVAGKLKLPYLPDRKAWSWADLGLHGVHDYITRAATPLHRMPSHRPVPSQSKSQQAGLGTLTSSPPGVVQSGLVSPYSTDFSSIHYPSFSTSPQYPPVTCAPLLPSQMLAGPRYSSCPCDMAPYHKTEGKGVPCDIPEHRDRARYHKGFWKQGSTGGDRGRTYYGQPPPADTAMSAEWISPFPTASLKESCGLPPTNDSSDFMHPWPEYYSSPGPDHVLPTIADGYGQLPNPEQNFRR